MRFVPFHESMLLLYPRYLLTGCKQVPPKGHPNNVLKRLYKRLKNILEYNSFSTSVKKQIFSFCKDVTEMHILTKVRLFESHEQSLLFKFEDLQKSHFYKKRSLSTFPPSGQLTK